MMKGSSFLVGFGLALVVAGSLMPGSALASSHSELSRLNHRAPQAPRSMRGIAIVHSAAADAAREGGASPFAGFVVATARRLVVNFVADGATARARSDRGAAVNKPRG